MWSKIVAASLPLCGAIISSKTIQNEIPRASTIQSVVQGTALVESSQADVSTEAALNDSTIVVVETVPVIEMKAVEKQIGTERKQHAVTEMVTVDRVVATATQHVSVQVREK